MALVLLCATWLLAGCTSTAPRAAGDRPFRFETDTFAYANGLLWEYAFDAQGRWRSHARAPRPDYTHHCFVVARSAKQFFQHARFEPTLPKATEVEYRRLVRRVVGTSLRKDLPTDRKIVIPGYPNLREFSREHASLLKAACGSFWQSYFQRGHWRMLFPFSRKHQEKTAARLAESIGRNRPPVVHIVCFPSLRINHALVLFGVVADTPEELGFEAYDPNAPEQPTRLTYRRSDRRFHFPTNAYFPGGAVDIYEVYCGGCY